MSSSNKSKIRYVLSIAVRENCLNWALHQGTRQSFYLPVIFWRTRRVQASDISNISAASVHGVEKSALSPHLHHPLSRFLTRFVNNNILGISSRHGSGKSKKSDVNGKNCLKVYIVAPTGENGQVTLIRKLWKNISSQIIILGKDDFLDKEEINDLASATFKDLKVDCLVALRGSSYLHGYPSLVFDFGGQMTSYMAADRNGCIIGKGLLLGLDLKLKAWKVHESLAKHESLSSSNTFLAKAVEMIESKNTTTMFTGDPVEIVITEIMSEIKAKVLDVIEEWVNSFSDDDDAKTQPASDSSARSRCFAKCESNRSRTIVITGENAPFLIQLLTDDPLVCESMDNDLFKLKHEKYVIAYGVSSALLRKARSKEASTVTETDNPTAEVSSTQAILSDWMQKRLEKDKKLKDLVGRRVAKRFYAEKSNKCHIYRGTVAAFQPSTVGLDGGMGSGDKEIMYFFIKYDDGDREHVKSQELNSMLSLYKTVGEENGAAKYEKMNKQSATNPICPSEFAACSVKKQLPAERKGERDVTTKNAS
eukprot:CAMPEP_0196816254 /NCGR_PEP_ID=MMETSP1362-20130617/54326_1 /TAXON_ID=163516 /ORGANISM="Leptocylindrus danicus, Strain CCMP1856" /LENGTH=535 /DNA_ID=CAMNT_0042193509 /DNA_START=151 /DNA_END=1758 /DNA_ORIENTATION=-